LNCTEIVLFDLDLNIQNQNAEPFANLFQFVQQ